MPGQAECSQCGRGADGYTAPSAASTASPFVDRYRDAYRVSSFLTGLGDTVKVAGFVIGGLMLLMGLASLGGASGFFGGLVLGGAFGGLFFVCGVMISAQGQLLRASLDGAVSGSRFMTDADCLAAMGMPAGIASAREVV